MGDWIDGTGSFLLFRFHDLDRIVVWEVESPGGGFHLLRLPVLVDRLSWRLVHCQDCTPSCMHLSCSSQTSLDHPSLT